MISQSFRLPHVKWVFPTAPSRPITLNNGMTMPGGASCRLQLSHNARVISKHRVFRITFNPRSRKVTKADGFQVGLTSTEWTDCYRGMWIMKGSQRQRIISTAWWKLNCKQECPPSALLLVASHRQGYSETLENNVTKYCAGQSSPTQAPVPHSILYIQLQLFLLTSLLQKLRMRASLCHFQVFPLYQIDRQ